MKVSGVQYTTKPLKLVTDPSKQSVGVMSYIRHFPSPVPCGGCTACCRSEFDINLNPADDPSQYLTEIGPKSGLPSLKKVNGACVYLKDDRCSIYERRPITCRVFDCRIDVLCGVTTPELWNDAAWEKFDFTYKEPEDRVLRRSLVLLTGLLVRLCPTYSEAAATAVTSMAVVLKKYGDVRMAIIVMMKNIGEEYQRRGMPLPMPPPDEGAV